jgi:hypothetical protein
MTSHSRAFLTGLGARELGEYRRVSTFEREICGPLNTQGTFRRKLAVLACLAARRIRRHRTLVRPKQETLAQVAGHIESASPRIDHAPWNAILAQYLVVGDINRFRYSKVTSADRGRLRHILSKCLEFDRRFPTSRTAAYWVNLYNSLTVDLVLDRYPVSSIRDIAISPGLFPPGHGTRR